MGNIHIFIADELHERLRKVCRHKVTQQKFLEEGIEKLVSEMEKGKIQPERFRDYKSLEARDGIRPPTEEEVIVFLDEFIPYEKVQEGAGLELSSSAIVDEAGEKRDEKIYFDNGATVVLTGEDEEVACEGVAISPQYYVPDDKEDE